jgi:molybdenum cofactor biosynthesis enzyme MoaA
MNIPGRGVLRISLTPRCNLRCSHCHNEGQPKPWLHEAGIHARLADLDNLIDVASRRGATTVRFTGGDPGVYAHFYELMERVPHWRNAYPSIAKWGLTTNGIAFLAARKFTALASSELTDIAIGVDSVDPRELSRPSSPSGISGAVVFDRIIDPLRKTFTGKIKVDVVFTGNADRTLNVVRRARQSALPVTVLEINGVMGERFETRAAFERLRDRVIDEFSLTARLNSDLNEIEADDVKFYPDHCADRECGVCRKLDFRVHHSPRGLAAIPCYEQGQLKTIPLMEGGKMIEERFDDAIRHNGGGPEWDLPLKHCGDAAHSLGNQENEDSINPGTTESV